MGNIQFLAVRRTLSKICHTLIHKASVNKYKKIERVSHILSDNNERKLGINNEKL
jgi:hypothetical protein